MQKHDESKCVNSLNRIGVRVTRNGLNNKCLCAPKDTVIGIHSWGKIDYLVHYCGYTFVWTAPKGETSERVKRNKRKKRNIYDVEEQ